MLFCPSLLAICNPSTPRRANFPLVGTQPAKVMIELSLVPVSSCRISDNTSAGPPQSPINPFLIPPLQSPFRMASPLLPASPLSIFDHAISPGYVVSPTGSMVGMDIEGGASLLEATFLQLCTPTPTRRTFPSPLSPRFISPRTPPCSRKLGMEIRRRTSTAQARKASVPGVLTIGRKASTGSVLTMGQERLKMKSNFCWWLVMRHWEGFRKWKRTKERYG